MKRIAIAVTLLAALGAACAKATSDGPTPDANQSSTLKAASAAAASAYVESLGQLTVGSLQAASAAAANAYVESLQASVVGLSDGLTKAAMVEAGLTNFTGIAPRGELPSGAPRAGQITGNEVGNS